MKITDKINSWVGKCVLAATQRDHTGWFVDWAQGGQSTAAGINVSNDTALQLSTVFDCLRVISEDVGKLPYKVYKNIKPRGKEPQPNHPIYTLLHDRANRDMSAMTFRETLTSHALGWGNGYAEIERDIEGHPINLWPLRPDRVRVFRLDDGWIWYEYLTDQNVQIWIRSDNVLHIKGFGPDGLVGYNVIRYAREALGAAMATQTFAATFFGNGALQTGTLTHPGTLTGPAQDNLRKSMQQYQGISNSMRVMILEEGMKFEPNSVPPEEAQFLETRQFSVPDICRWFRMPPNKVGDTTRAQGWSTLEQTNIDYVTDTLLGWLTAWEQEVWFKLFTPREREQGYFTKHVVAGLLRGDIQTRYAAYAVGRNWSWLNADDIRELEDLNPIPEKKGQTYLMPLNMTEAKAPGEMDDIVTVPTSPQNDDALNAFVQDAADRIASCEIREIGKVVGKGSGDKFRAWVTAFFNQHADYIAKVLSPLAKACRGELSTMVIIKRLTSEGVNAFTNGSPQEVLGEWREKRSESILETIKGVLNVTTNTK